MSLPVPPSRVMALRGVARAAGHRQGVVAAPALVPVVAADAPGDAGVVDDVEDVGAHQVVGEAGRNQVLDPAQGVGPLAGSCTGRQVDGDPRGGERVVGDVDAVAADQLVVADAAEHGVVADAAVEAVVALVAEQLVGRDAADHGVVAQAAAGKDPLDVDELACGPAAKGDEVGLFRVGDVDEQVARHAAVEQVDGIVAVAALDGVEAAGGSGDAVRVAVRGGASAVAKTLHDGVVAGAGVDPVVPETRDDHVVAQAAVGWCQLPSLWLSGVLRRWTSPTSRSAPSPPSMRSSPLSAPVIRSPPAAPISGWRLWSRPISSR